MNKKTDLLQRFLLERAGVSGVLVKLEESWQEVAERGEYAPAVHELLGEALAATALLTGNIKLNGSLSIQLKSDGPVRLLFTECTDAGRLRGLAQTDTELPDRLSLFQLKSPLMAITIENASSGQRYQGMVPVEQGTLSHLIEGYFIRSEQLPTHIQLVCEGGKAAGLLLQPLAQGGGIGDADPDGWNRVKHLAATLTREELTQLPVEEILRRLFHEENAVLTDSRPLAFGCQCSRERVAAVLRNLGREEAEAAIQIDGRVEVTCEFCNSRYHFDRVDLAQLFRDEPETPGSTATH
ncbi:Hsp33 family molecular chaperone HslO [Tahibacter amnicola]|uniref:Hsp33 family molecular chaperone HslO n=1 Tax=Tahibacter amnicola TaxID=2976241 RepID=A0ABY6BCN0_9GAMM|nr:Hsp33 family molecular chaperone HslO [Tahibacter amnicola]UXI67619.1 Hsp33 family molecular chaperone HslO [Tahibacter amnicola]